jgi:hypothetical protein
MGILAGGDRLPEFNWNRSTDQRKRLADQPSRAKETGERSDSRSHAIAPPQPGIAVACEVTDVLGGEGDLVTCATDCGSKRSQDCRDVKHVGRGSRNPSWRASSPNWAA